MGAFFAAFFLATVRPPKRLGETWTEFWVKLLKRYSPLLMPHSRISGVWAEATSRMSPHPHTRGLKLLGINLRLQKLFLQHALTLILRLPRKSSRGNAPPRAIFVKKVFGPSSRQKRARWQNFFSARVRCAARHDFSALTAAPGLVRNNELARSYAFGSIFSHSLSSSLALGSGQTRR